MSPDPYQPVPVPDGAQYLGTLDANEYYKYNGAVWCRTALGWSGVCLVSDWAARPEARALANADPTPPLHEREI